ncbi:MAG: TonB-dependent receptor [Candidatus Aminicenantes bacterium]|nr:TonB-dependent receptor [Candidatus Aminicenantes bacterium]
MKLREKLRPAILILLVILITVPLKSLPASDNYEKNKDQKNTVEKAQKSEQKKAKTEKAGETEKLLENEIFHPREEIIVTATMTPKAIKDCTVAATVVTQQELKALDVTNAMNALMFVPGVFVMRTGDFGRADVEIRGLGQRGQRLGVMVDGRPEKMGIFGCVVTQTFPFDNVERIEVVRGPASVLYGSDALGGMVNIITHTPQKGWETEAIGSYGSFDTRRFTLRHGAGLERFGYYFTFDDSRSDGHIANSSYSGRSFTGKVYSDLGHSWRLTLNGKYYDGKKYEPLITYTTPPPELWNDYKRGGFDLTLSHQAASKDFSLKIYTDLGHHVFSDGWNSRDHVCGGVLRYTLTNWKYNELTLGADFRYLQGKSYNFPVGQWDKNEGGIFVQNQYVLKKRLILNGGFRVNRDSSYGWEFVPSAGAIFLLNETTSFRGLISKGFRSPQLSELYLYPTSNPDLHPERLWNYELGFSKQFGTRVNFDLTLFLMNGKDLIQLAANPTPPPQFKLTNIGHYKAKGFEASLRGQISPYLMASAYVTYLDPGEETIGKAKQKYDFSLIFKKGRIFSSLTAQYVTDYYAGNNHTNPLPSFFLLNAKVDLDLSRYFGVFLALNNILDVDYKIYVNLPGQAAGAYPMPGRSINIGLRIKP